MNDHQGLSRRHVLGMAIAAGGFALSGAASSVFAQALRRTPGEILGPFYPVLRSVEKTADLTTLPGKPGRAAGQVIYVMGRVLNVQKQPVKGARVERGKQTRTDATSTRVIRTQRRSIPTSRASPFRTPMPKAVIASRRSSPGRIQRLPTGCGPLTFTSK